MSPRPAEANFQEAEMAFAPLEDDEEIEGLGEENGSTIGFQR